MIFEKIHDKENLYGAWRHVRGKSKCAGYDQVATRDFGNALPENIDALSAELRDGSYRPLPVVAFTDRSRPGKERELGISAVRDRVVQQAVARVLASVFEPRFLPCSYAYRPKKSAARAVRKAEELIARGCRWMLKMDVEKFFDSMDHRTLIGLVEETVEDKKLSRLLSRLLKAKVFKEMELLENDVGSHQGSGLSPLLSNIYLHPFDRAMWERYQDRYLRYSDDIAVFSEENDDLDRAKQTAKELLAGLKLANNPEKTVISSVSAGISYLGFYMDEDGKGPDKKSIEQFEQRLELIKPVRRTDHIPDRIKEVDAKMHGWYSYYKSVKSLTPQNLLSLVGMVRLAMDAGEIEYARNLLGQHEIFPCSHPDLLFQIGELFLSLGMPSRAAGQYAKALEIDPSMCAAKNRIDDLKQDQGNVRRTIENVKTVLHKDPGYRDGYRKLADCYSRMGLYGFAEKAAQKVLEIRDEPQARKSVENIRLQSRQNLQDLSFDEDHLENFLETLRGRGDSHARQWVDENGRCAYIRVERPMNIDDVRRHLAGEDTLAVYPVTVRDTVEFIVFDVDVSKRKILVSDASLLPRFREKTHEDILRIKRVCESMGLSMIVEDSGYKGRHGWGGSTRNT